MQPDDYYREMRKLANEQRTVFGLKTSGIGRREFRAIFAQHNIKVHLWPKPGLTGKPLNNLRGAYLNVDGDRHVMVDRQLPNDPYLFTLAHELKHHLCDSELAQAFCHDGNQTEVIEVGAEIFAAELLYPQREFTDDMQNLGIKKGECTQKDLVVLKHETGTSLSYAGLRKRAINFGYAPKSMSQKGWKQIENNLYGVPFYLRKHTYRQT